MTRPLKPVSDQVIVITGASSGIGLATARMAADRGARVMLIARDADALREAVLAITAGGGTADCYAADVNDTTAMQAAAAHARQRFGGIDTWINAAGSAIYGTLANLPVEEHRRLFDTNYFGTVNGCQAAIPYLRETRGALLTIGSIVSDLPSPVMGAYAATKHAIKAYVEALRMELAADGAPITVTLVKPSGIDTPIAQHAVNHEPGEAQIPPPVYAPELVADALLFCASHPRREITVGGAGRAQALFAAHFPRLFERLAPIAATTFVDPDKRQPPHANLFASADTGRVHSGDHPAARATSLYTAAALRPGMTLAGLTALSAGVAAVLHRRRTAHT